MAEIFYIHGVGCKADESGLRSDCTCNLRGEEYDAGWVSIEKVKEARSHLALAENQIAGALHDLGVPND